MLQDLQLHVSNAFGEGTNKEIEMLCNDPSRVLGLLMLLSLCQTIKTSVDNIAGLVEAMPLELQAILQPAHVLMWIHSNLPRADISTGSHVIFTFDRVVFPSLAVDFILLAKAFNSIREFLRAGRS